MNEIRTTPPPHTVPARGGGRRGRPACRAPPAPYLAAPDMTSDARKDGRAGPGEPGCVAMATPASGDRARNGGCEGPVHGHNHGPRTRVPQHPKHCVHPPPYSGASVVCHHHSHERKKKKKAQLSN